MLRRAWFFLALLLAGCQPPLQRLQQLSAAHAHRVEIYPTAPFPLALSLPQQAPAASHLRVYLEGEGHAWATASQPSLDPSPHQLLLAELALSDPQPSVYLARPCQFVSAPACRPALWTDRRFAAEVLASLDQALEQLKRRYGNPSFELIGYSGGGALALLLAARRDDVELVQTLAGNLTPTQWTQLLHLRLLQDAREPLSERARLAQIPQRHLAGAADPIVPPQLLELYRRQLGPANCLEIAVLPGVSHAEGWAQAWPQWRDRPLRCQP
ncbi:alpha/beta hydrolase [Pseudomonas cavernae]|uniref:Alpha/beta hydrolase n=1 Tax=Pseudomonas cavernae TaxID=2320867 RepID=A0A385ZAI4_9PSED|nr:alpha/beta hydrolase [Pseudomonas cavernae]AYC34938.1 alpha/beta hydrolase [Pseudomonas cavernae]